MPLSASRRLLLLLLPPASCPAPGLVNLPPCQLWLVVLVCCRLCLLPPSPLTRPCKVTVSLPWLVAAASFPSLTRLRPSVRPSDPSKARMKPNTKQICGVCRALFVSALLLVTRSDPSRVPPRPSPVSSARHVASPVKVSCECHRHTLGLVVSPLSASPLCRQQFSPIAVRSLTQGYRVTPSPTPRLARSPAAFRPPLARRLRLPGLLL